MALVGTRRYPSFHLESHSRSSPHKWSTLKATYDHWPKLPEVSEQCWNNHSCPLETVPFRRVFWMPSIRFQFFTDVLVGSSLGLFIEWQQNSWALSWSIKSTNDIRFSLQLYYFFCKPTDVRSLWSEFYIHMVEDYPFTSTAMGSNLPNMPWGIWWPSDSIWTINHKLWFVNIYIGDNWR